ncbi:TetR/AcrR family transcriptional regulator [Paraglaciecola hydrolytica]|uniref:HTH tetR-type domain-containing protein n=1 Tax=Paraglaciecola hydrolytica TaxID=1799789 RepID=A0A136A242_9ALTE|nr:TetR/AcrR family transcriptional regulator [Paraglaciecola hydrolytica]KXI29305.1 hypothetical protein AX660_14280 [Paraglaciecola hydrolytica]
MSQCELSKAITKLIKPGRPKSIEKRDSILAAAQKLILELGYSATTMDLVATEAKVSKQTVYSHFSNKETLFTAIVILKCQQHQITEQPHTDKQEIFETLYKIGRQIVSLLQQADVVAMYRVVIAEVGSNPQVAKLFYEAGPQQSKQMLADYLLSQAEFKFSREDSYVWAMTYLNMLKGDFHMRSILGLSYELSDEQQQQLVSKSVANFKKLLLN